MIKRRNTPLDIIAMVACRVIFVFLVICGLMLYARYEWMMTR